jgi:hypothetical protein
VQEVNDEQGTNIVYLPVGSCPPDSQYSYANEDFGLKGFMSFLDLIFDYEDCMFDGVLREWKKEKPDLVVRCLFTVSQLVDR